MKKYGSLLLALVLIAILVGGGWYLMNTLIQPEDTVEVGDNLEVGDSMLERFSEVMNVSETAEKTELRAVVGRTGSGIATREVVGGKLIHTIMADLPDPGEGRFYEGWLVGESIVSTGKMVEKKGGWILEYFGEERLFNYDSVVVTIETKDDNKPEAHVLEGLFK